VLLLLTLARSIFIVQCSFHLGGQMEREPTPTLCFCLSSPNEGPLSSAAGQEPRRASRRCNYWRVKKESEIMRSVSTVSQAGLTLTQMCDMGRVSGQGPRSKARTRMSQIKSFVFLKEENMNE